MTYEEAIRLNEAIANADEANKRGQNPVTQIANAVAANNIDTSDYLNQIMGLGYQQNLQRAKDLYETAAQGEAGDAQRAQAAAQGQAIRGALNKLGIDTSDADKLNAAGYKPIVEGQQQGLLNKFYSMETPDERYSRLRLDYLNQGMGQRKAHDLAMAETEPYAAQYNRMANITMGQLGTENGVMNKHGFTTALLGGNPERSVALYDAAYAMPKAGWAIDRNREDAATAHDYEKEMFDKQAELTKWATQYQGELQKALAAMGVYNRASGGGRSSSGGGGRASGGRASGSNRGGNGQGEKPTKGQSKLANRADVFATQLDWYLTQPRTPENQERYEDTISEFYEFRDEAAKSGEVDGDDIARLNVIGETYIQKGNNYYSGELTEREKLDKMFPVGRRGVGQR